MTAPTAVPASKDAAQAHLGAIERLYEDALAHIAEVFDRLTQPAEAVCETDQLAEAIVPMNTRPSLTRETAAA